MAVGPSPGDRAHVAIAGGGFAALEAALALRALAGDRLQLTLISPDAVFLYRPAATLEAFDDIAPRSYDLRAIADDLGAERRAARLEAVESRTRLLRLSSGVRLGYDALILSIGARAITSVSGALMFRDQRDLPLFHGLLRDLEAGLVNRLVFAVPSGSAWPLPLYELALLAATHVHERGLESDVYVVSPERAPLAMFGTQASELVADVLAERRVRFMGNSVATSVRRDGALTLRGDGAITADRVVTAPRLHAHRISGVPASWWGFVPTDMFGRVEGLSDVYAAGDMTTFPIKQGGLASQQADRIAHTIAASLGAPVKELRASQVLQARLVGGGHPLFLRTELDWQGHPTGATLEHSESGPATSSATKVFGRYLTPYLETLDPVEASPIPAA